MTPRQALKAIDDWTPALNYYRRFPRVATLMRENYITHNSFVEPTPIDLGPGPIDTRGD